MHELSLATPLLDLVQREALLHGLGRVTRIVIRVGALRQVLPGLLETAFRSLAEGTVCAGAELEIERVPLVARCARCERDVALPEPIFWCPDCAEPLEEVVSGEELDLVAIEGGEP